MIKTIVVPVDGSEYAERALEPASWLANTFEDDLDIVIASFSADTTREQEILERASALCPAASVHTEVMEHQFADRAIIRAVESAPDAALCMSTRGRGGLGEALLGSTANEVVRNVFQPIVLVGPGYQAMPADPTHLIVCVDGSSASSTILPIAAEWARDLDLHAHVVTVASGRELSASGTAAGRVEDAAAALRSHGIPTTVEVRTGRDAAGEVVALAESMGAALVAVATHGHSGYSPRALGHVVMDIVRNSPCPVLVRRIPKPEGP